MNPMPCTTHTTRTTAPSPSITPARPGRRRVLGLGLAAAGLLAGCGQVLKLAEGEVVVRERLQVTTARPWNQFERGVGDGVTVWTREGVTIDALRFWVGLKDGELLAPTPAQPKGATPLAFKRTMQAGDVVALVESWIVRDGSSFTLERNEPAEFIGQGGFRFEFSSVRKADDVQIKGIGWGAVRNGELFLITYTAPRLAFFPRGAADAEALAKSARVRG
jgi:hypothetical protein